MNKNTKIKNGFTVIELLMVIALIALIVALTIVAVSLARVKANNSRIKSDMDQLRKQAEIIYAENGMAGYCVTGKMCFNNAEPSLVSLVNDIKNKNGGINPTLSTGTNTYCAAAVLADNKTICFDSTGKQTGTAYNAVTTGTCSSGTTVSCQ